MRFAFIDNAYIGINKIENIRLDTSYFAPSRSQWLDLGFKLDKSNQGGTFVLSLSDNDLDTWAYSLMPRPFRWMQPTMGQPFDLDIREGESLNNCAVAEKYTYCYIDPNSDEYRQFIKASNKPMPNDEAVMFKILVVFENYEKLDYED
jgi:hypothetical protein